MQKGSILFMQGWHLSEVNTLLPPYLQVHYLWISSPLTQKEQQKDFHGVNSNIHYLSRANTFQSVTTTVPPTLLDVGYHSGFCLGLLPTFLLAPQSDNVRKLLDQDGAHTEVLPTLELLDGQGWET